MTITPARKTLLPSLLAIGAAVATCLLGGCGAPTSGHVTIDQWQRDFETYVEESGNGDLNVIRELDYKPPYYQFTSLGGAHGETSTDVVGLYLGRARAHGVIWHVYLVGVNAKRSVVDMRMAAVRRSGDELVWRIGGSNAAALNEYTAHRKRGWEERHPDRDQPPAMYTEFPGMADDFVMASTGGLLTVRDRTSDALWSMSLGSQALAGAGSP